MKKGYYLIIRGPLGIGKTTISALLARSLKAEYISMDKVLEENGLDKVNEDEGCIPARNFIKADRIILPKAKSLLEKGKAVIFDGCFYHKEQIEHLERELDYNHFIFDLKAPLKICISRDRKRKKSYGLGAAIAVYNLVSRFDYGVAMNTQGKSADKVVKSIGEYIQSIKNKYKFIKYDPSYPKLFEKEKKKLKKILPKAVIEHVGSTSIPGLGGKGIIDIAILVRKEEIENALSKIKRLNFEYKHQVGDTQRKFMQKVVRYTGNERRVHVHLTSDKPYFTTYIAFRDHMRENEKDRKEYARIKKEAIKVAGLNYLKYKREFMQKTSDAAVQKMKNKS